jgi:hypothetical protein
MPSGRERINICHLHRMQFEDLPDSLNCKMFCSGTLP